MGKYLRKYNKETQKWEILSPNYANDVFVTNPLFSSTSGAPQTLDTVLTTINSDIVQLKQNVSWLAEHGGGGGVGGSGGGSANTYRFFIENGADADTLYISNTPYTIKFKIVGGSPTDKVKYTVMYDGRMLTNGEKECKVNSLQTIIIPEFTEGISTHILQFEGVDENGMTIGPRSITILESSLKLRLNDSVFRYAITDGGDFSVYVTNKAINSPTYLTVTNLNTTVSKTFQFTTRGAAEEAYTFNLFNGENEQDRLFISNNVAIGKKYTLSISAYTETVNGANITSNVLTPEIWFTSPQSFAIVTEGIVPYEDIVGGLSQPSEIEMGANLTFNFTIYHGGIANVYYAVVMSKNSGDTYDNGDDVIYGVYSATTKEEVAEYAPIATGSRAFVQFQIPKNDLYLGERFVKIKCWSTDFAVSAHSVYQINIIASDLETFNLQTPTRIGEGGMGHTMFLEFDAFCDVVSNKMPTNASAHRWETRQIGYQGYSDAEGKALVWNPSTTMELYGTNGLQSGFVNRGNIKVIRFQGDSYGKILSPFSNPIELSEHKAYTLSIAYKADEHPSNDKTVFEWCTYDNTGKVAQGIKISLEKIEWLLYSKRNGSDVRETLSVNIQQNVKNAIDFVFIGSDASGNGEKGIAKIFVNGVVNAAVEVGTINTTFMENNDMHIACSNKKRSGVDNFCDFADIDLYSIRLFTSALNDVEIIVNSHNSIAERNSNGAIDNEAYKAWKEKNYLTLDATRNIPTSLLYNLDGVKYNTNVTFTQLQNSSPLPIIYIDASKSQTSSGQKFSEPWFYTSHQDTKVTSYTFTNCTLYYCDKKLKQDVITAEQVAISLQGTSSVTYRSKNLEVYFQKICEGYDDETKTQLFQPREDWFPESQFTLKADVVDSAHANNAVLGKWINQLTDIGLMDKNPAEEMIAKMPPEDKVIYNNDYENPINHNPNDSITWPSHSNLKIKNTLEGFSVLLLVKFNNDGLSGYSNNEQLLGIYSFNLGRYSYYNLGLKFFKYFSRRKLNGETFIEQTCPALIDYYDYYKNDEIITQDGMTLRPRDFVSFEFGGGADINESNYATWSQNDLSMLSKIGSFRYHGASDNPSISPDIPSGNDKNGWLNLQALFTTTSQCEPRSYMYRYNTDEQQYQQILDENGEPRQHSDGGDQGYQKLVEQLNIKNSMVYFVICSVFGMVDSLGKNFTLRSWNCNFENQETISQTKWYPCFYDMDTALGITNEGAEIVEYDAYIDKYYNREIEWDEQGHPINANSMMISPNYSTAEMQNRYGAYNSKLWRILRKKNESSLATLWNEDKSSILSSAFKSRSQYTGMFYEEIYRDLRAEGGLLNNADNFIQIFTSQTANCGEIMFNFDYTIKYLTKYTYKVGDAQISGLGNIQMLHGNRKEYVRSWLNNRLLFLDGVFEIDAYGGQNKPIVQAGTFTFAGNIDCPRPYFTFMVTNPSFFNISVGQSSSSRYYVTPYTDTIISFPENVDGAKQASLNNNTLITKFEGLKDFRLNEFKTLSLPKLTKIDFSNITTFYNNNPINFHTVFTFNTKLKDEGGNVLFSSNIREINLSNAKQNGETNNSNASFNLLLYTTSVNDKGETIIYNFDRLKKINIYNSCVSQLILPSAILEELDVRKSDITSLNVSSQPLLDNINVEGCNKLISIEINTCSKITELSFNNMTELTSVTISNCVNLTNVCVSGNTSLQNIIIENCSKLEQVCLDGNTHSDLEIRIISCDNLISFSAQNLYSTKTLTLPSNVRNITTFNVYNWSGLQEIQYGSNSSTYELFSDEQWNGGKHIKYVEKDNEYTVLDLSPMVNIKSLQVGTSSKHFYKNLLTSTLNLQFCSAIECVKFRNDIDEPFVLNVASGFTGCTKLKRVFGHVVLHGDSDFREKTYFNIHSVEESDAKFINGKTVRDVDDFNKFKTSNNNMVTNFRVTTFSSTLRDTFAFTNCSLYDAYYFLYKLSTDTNYADISGKTTLQKETIKYSTFSSIFRKCSQINFKDKENLDINAYANCHITNSFSNPFYECQNTNKIIYYSPIIENGVCKINGTLTPIIKNGAKSLHNISGYCDKDIFATDASTKNLIQYVTYISLSYVENTYREDNEVDRTKLTILPINDCDILKDLPSLTSITYSFSNLKVNFDTYNTYVYDENYEGTRQTVLCTHLFLKQPNLRSIQHSFNNINGKGQIKRLFGYKGIKEGYENATSSKRIPIFPSGLTKVINSLSFGDSLSGSTNPRLYITEDFFSNIKDTIEYFSCGTNNTNDEKKFIFSGKITKILDNETASFPYKIFQGCKKLKEIPYFFANVQWGLEGNKLENVTLPNYYENTELQSIFKDCKSLSNIGYLFYNMNNIEYELNGFGFKQCSGLTNVEKCFAYSNNDLAETPILRRKGAIPYGLFYQEHTVTKNPIRGYTEEMAAQLGINETVGIINPCYDINGNVTKNIVFSETDFDKDGNPKILSGLTQPDSSKTYTVYNILDKSVTTLPFKYQINEYGVILDDYVFIDGIKQDPQLAETLVGQQINSQSAFTYSYTTYNPTIVNMKECFAYNDGKKLEHYQLSNDDELIDENSLVVDNENYNEIKYIVNTNYDPILYNKEYNPDTKTITLKLNENYDPRRYLLNSGWNIYKKKFNKYYYDGVRDMDVFKEKYTNQIDPSSLVEFSEEFHSLAKPINDSQPEEIKERLNTRNYAFAPDILLYCANTSSVNVNGLFKYAGGSNISNHSTRTKFFPYIDYGIRGTIPAFMLDSLTTITTFNDVFKGCRGILPDEWGSITENDTFKEGRALPATLFSKTPNITSMTGTFAEMVFYGTTYVRPIQDNDVHIFSNMPSLANMSYCFALTAWLGGDADATINPLNNAMFSKYNINVNQLSNQPFEKLTALSDITYMFNGDVENTTQDRRTDLRYFDNNLFSHNKKLKYVSYVFNKCWHLKEAAGNGLIEFWDKQQFSSAQNILKPYNGCDKLEEQLKNNNKWKDNYESYFKG